MAAKRKKTARKKTPKKASRKRGPYRKDQRARARQPGSLRAARVKAGGKPRVVIDPLDVEKLAILGVPQREIADLLGFARKTMETRFEDTPELREAWVRGHAKMKKGIRSALMQSAVNDRSPTTLKFLAMTVLNMIPGLGDRDDDEDVDLRQVLTFSLAKFLANEESRRRPNPEDEAEDVDGVGRYDDDWE